MTTLYGVKKVTAYRICSLTKVINEECMNLLIQKIEQRPDITLSELRQLLIDIKSVVASIIARHLLK